MTREELAEASELTAAASDQTDGEPAERLADFSEQLDTLAERERGPDHGRLARILTALDGLKDDVTEEVAEKIEQAREKITEYRKGVEGV